MPDFAGATELGKQPPQKEVAAEPNKPIEAEIEVPENVYPAARELYVNLAELRQANAGLLGQIQSHGVGLDPNSLIQTRLSALIDTLFDGTTEEGQLGMLTVEYNFERAMAEVLKDASANVVKAILAQGSQVSPDQMAQMAQAAGIGVPAAFRKGG